MYRKRYSMPYNPSIHSHCGFDSLFRNLQSKFMASLNELLTTDKSKKLQNIFNKTIFKNKDNLIKS